jgi:SlyX protein
MSDNGDLINRIDTLETHIAHQDGIIEELNDLSSKQWVEIQKLNDRFDHLNNKFSELERDIETPPDEDAPPPHY